MNKQQTHSGSQAGDEAMNRVESLRWLVFLLVAAAFTNIYITQPLLPVLETEFAADTVTVAWTVTAVLLGFALANLPFGALSDRVGTKPLIIGGGAAIALAGAVCAVAPTLDLLIAARFVQGLFLPALTTCVAAYIARILPPAMLNTAMGAYVAATILGGMCGRLLGGWVVAPDAWRSAFVLAGALVAVVTVVAAKRLPADIISGGHSQPRVRYRDLLRADLLPVFACAAAGQAVFSPVFNTIPYRLAEAPMNLSTRESSLLYLVYIVGVFIGPAAGRLSDRYGNGRTLMLGAAVLLVALGILALASVGAIALGLVGICAGFFAVHAAAVGALNGKLSAGQGRANALYVLSYYLGACAGIAWSAYVYQHHGWPALLGVAACLCLIPFATGWLELRAVQRAQR